MWRSRGVWLVAFTLTLTILSSSFAYAAEITKVKGRGVLVNLAGEEAQVGDQFYLIADGKKKAIVQITKVKGEQAIGKVTAGKADVGMTLQRRPGHVVQNGSSDSSSGGKSQYLKSKAYWGGLLGYSLDSMAVDLPSGVSASMNGGGISALGVFDYKLFDRGWFRGEAGYQNFSATGSSVCSGAAACNVNINYLDFAFLFRYLFTDGALRPWAGGGFSMLFPMTKTSTALDTSSISNSGILILSGGVDWSISPKMYIPISIEYGMFPKSASVEASWITVRGGLAVPF